MGLDVHAINFLKYCTKNRKMGAVATLGRQGISVNTDKLSKLLNKMDCSKYDKYCEQLLIDIFNAEIVDSYDCSPFENATHIYDFNKNIFFENIYDTVIDSGTSEHIFNVSNALLNTSKLCRDGGQIIHCLPANNYCGHGFWQFSPELFFSLYSEKNGYSNTEIFLANMDNEHYWYEVKKPSQSNRALVYSSRQIYVLVKTFRKGQFSHDNIQQSDYVYYWDKHINNAGANDSPNIANTIFKSNIFTNIASAFYNYTPKLIQRLCKHILIGLHKNNPSLVRHKVSDLLNAVSQNG